MIYIYDENKQFDLEIQENPEKMINMLNALETVNVKDIFPVNEYEDNKIKEVEKMAITYFRAGCFSLKGGALKDTLRYFDLSLEIYEQFRKYKCTLAHNIVDICEHIIGIFDEKSDPRKIKYYEKIVEEIEALNTESEKKYILWFEKMLAEIRIASILLDNGDKEGAGITIDIVKAEIMVAQDDKEFLKEVNRRRIELVIEQFSKVYVLSKRSAEGIEKKSDITDGKSEFKDDEMLDDLLDFVDLDYRGNIKNMLTKLQSFRMTLEKNIYGQNKAIDTFLNGIWNVTLFDGMDTERKGPKSVFLFAGAPGCGKTYLAETGAEILGLPYKRFNMSEYSTHSSADDLIGFAEAYKGATKGILTEFVKNNPKSVIIFDEIEKAHQNTIHLFLQILDAGVLQDMHERRDVSFKDTIIIFTTNVGRSIYDEFGKYDFSKVSKKEIIESLETEINPVTNEPFFPRAICSRLSKGNLCMFNKLSASNLEEIVEKKLKECADKFKKKYNIEVTWEDKIPMLLLLTQGELADARNMSAQAEAFFKEEIKKTLQLYNAENVDELLENCKEIRFKADLNDATDEVTDMMSKNAQQDILIVGSNEFSNRLKKEIHSENIVHTVESITNIDEILKETDIGMAFIAVNERERKEGTTIVFDRVPITSKKLRKTKDAIETITEKYSDMSIYLVEDGFTIDEELEREFMNLGVEKVLRNLDVEDSLKERMLEIRENKKMHQILNKISNMHKYMSFETAPLKSADSSLSIRLRNFLLKQTVDSKDKGAILSEVEKPDVKMEDIIGAKEAKEELISFIEYLKNPKGYAGKNIRVPKGVLLYGPAGTGKTKLAKAMASESGANFISVKATEFVQATVGSGPQAVRELFAKAARYQPCIIFIDEIDAIGTQRGNINAHSEEMTLNALLTEMDGFSTDWRKSVFVLAATNAGIGKGYQGAGVLDAALVRRFDSAICVDLPTKEERFTFLTRYFTTNDNHSVSKEALENIADRTVGLSIANLENVISRATREAIKKSTLLSDVILDEALEFVMYGEKTDWGNDTLKKVARHEAGHALLSTLSGKIPSYLTIVSRGGHGGYMQYPDGINKPTYSRNELLADVRTKLAGRASEMVYYGINEGISTGASADLKSASSIVRHMICDWGMDDEFGLATIDENDLKGPLGERIHNKVSKVLSDELNNTISIITAYQKQLNELVESLLMNNKLTGEDIKKILSDLVLCQDLVQIKMRYFAC